MIFSSTSSVEAQKKEGVPISYCVSDMYCKFICVKQHSSVWVSVPTFELIPPNEQYGWTVWTCLGHIHSEHSGMMAVLRLTNIACSDYHSVEVSRLSLQHIYAYDIHWRSLRSGTEHGVSQNDKVKNEPGIVDVNPSIPIPSRYRFTSIIYTIGRLHCFEIHVASTDCVIYRIL